MKPKIKIALTKADKVLEGVCIILLILMWCFIFFYVKSAPDTVPVHYNLAGEADGYGSSNTLFFVFLIPTLIYFGMTQLNKCPHIFNYMTRITEENAVKQYTLATRTLRLLKFSVLLIFSTDSLFLFLTLKGYTKSPGVFFLPLSILFLLTPLIYILYHYIMNKPETTKG